MPGLPLRRAGEADRGALQSLHEECLPVRYSPAFFQRACEDRGGRRLAAVATDGADGAAVAFVLAVEHRLWRVSEDLVGEDGLRGDSAAAALYIQTLGVTASWRRRGLARALLAWLCAHYVRPHVRAVYLHVLEANVSARALYERAGFEVVAVLPAYYSFHGARHDARLLRACVHGARPPPTSPFELAFWAHTAARWHARLRRSIAPLLGYDTDPDADSDDNEDDDARSDFEDNVDKDRETGVP